LQWTKPILDNAITWYMQQGQFNYFGILERMLKLSVPNLAIWVLLFFAFFHSFLNATAELLRFADRQFYKDWWNARTLKDYWNRCVARPSKTLGRRSHGSIGAGCCQCPLMATV
jgi:diacylglycerol O-acyltransferase-1